MPEKRIIEALNGSTTAGAAANDTASDADWQTGRYRPKASTTDVHDVVISALAEVVSSAVRNTGSFVYLAEHYDRDAATAIRLGHLVDATECIEIAMTHLSQLKAAMNHRLHTEDEQNTGTPVSWDDPLPI